MMQNLGWMNITSYNSFKTLYAAQMLLTWNRNMKPSKMEIDFNNI